MAEGGKTHTLRLGLCKFNTQGHTHHWRRLLSFLQGLSRGQDPGSEGRAEKGGEKGDSHEDVKRPPKDRLSKEASDPHPEDVWNLERGQKTQRHL